jgi:hypothetical protein
MAARITTGAATTTGVAAIIMEEAAATIMEGAEATIMEGVAATIMEGAEATIAVRRRHARSLSSLFRLAFDMTPATLLRGA